MNKPKIELLLEETEKQIKRVEANPTDTGWHTVAEVVLLRTRAELIKINENHPESHLKKKWVELTIRLNAIRYPPERRNNV